MRHFVLRLPFQHFTKHLLKEAFRLSHKSCLYYRMYPPQHSQEVGARGARGPASSFRARLLRYTLASVL